MKKVRYNDRMWFGKYKGIRACELLKNDTGFLIKLKESGLIEFDEKLKNSIKDRLEKRYAPPNAEIHENMRNNVIDEPMVRDHPVDNTPEPIRHITAGYQPMDHIPESPILERICHIPMVEPMGHMPEPTNRMVFSSDQSYGLDIMISSDFYYTGGLTEFFRKLINEAFSKIFLQREHPLIIDLRDNMLKKIIQNVSLNNYQYYNVKFHRRNQVRCPEDVFCEISSVSLLNDWHYTCDCTP
jgi:hypothetical protein